MLGRIANQIVEAPSCAPPLLHAPDRWKRNEMEDMKKAIEYLYEFREKLSNLHPVVLEAMENLLQRVRY